MKKNKTNILLIILCSIFYEFIILIGYKFLNIKELIYNSQVENLTAEQLEKILKIQSIAENFNFLINFILIFFKTIIIASLVYIGVYFFSKKQIVFKQIWHIVLKAEFIFLLVPVCKIIWFYFFETNYKLEDIQSFYPLSAINITGYNGIESWLIYPFQAINLFELAYILYLGYEVGKMTETSHDKGLKIIAYSYVPMMVLWITVVMFLTLNNS